MTTSTLPLPTTTPSSPATPWRRMLYSPGVMQSRGAPPDMIEIYAKIPDQAILDLVAFASRHDLTLTADIQEVMLMPRAGQQGVTWEIVCDPTGFCKIARRTGLYRPGTESISYVDDGLVVTVSGYYRDSTSSPWAFTASAFAHAHTYMEMTTPDEGGTWEPTLEWKAMPEVRLAEIARVLCIQQAIPEEMKGIRVSGMTRESVRRMKATHF